MKVLLIAIVRIYKFLISPILPGSCRFVPSCSEYSIEALRKYGALKGIYMSARRVAKCSPFHPGGYDPVK